MTGFTFGGDTHDYEQEYDNVEGGAIPVILIVKQFLTIRNIMAVITIIILLIYLFACATYGFMKSLLTVMIVLHTISIFNIF